MDLLRADREPRGDEIEALMSIYGAPALARLTEDAASDRFGIYIARTPGGSRDDGACEAAYALTLPAPLGDRSADRSPTNECPRSIAVAFTHPASYPSSAPTTIAVRGVRGVGGAAMEAALADLEATLQRIADDGVGGVTVYDCSVRAMEWLDDVWTTEHPREASGEHAGEDTAGGDARVSAEVRLDALAETLGDMTLTLTNEPPPASPPPPEGAVDATRDTDATDSAEDAVEDAAWASEDETATDSESDWSDAELREADAKTDSSAPPSAAQGAGRPWAHVARARRAARDAAAARGGGPRDEDGVQDEGGGGVFLGDLDAGAAGAVLSRLAPVDRARVAACRAVERRALTARAGGPRREPGASAGIRTHAELTAAMHERADAEGGGHLADAAWRDVDLRGCATAAALTTLRGLACGALRRLDVTGSRALRRGDLLELARESPKLRALRASSLSDTGKFTARDVELVLEACPSLDAFECDVGVKVDPRADPPDASEAALAAVLARRQTRVRRLKIHSACAASAASVAAIAARAASDKTSDKVGPRVRSLDVSWSLKLSDAAASGVASAMETHGRGWPLRRLAMRKANIRDDGAMSLAGAIRRAAEAVARWSEKGDGSSDHPETARVAREPLCRLRWLDLGSNMIGDAGGRVLAEALGPRVPITRLNLRDNQIGPASCLALGHAVGRCAATLRRVDLAHSGFGDAGAVALARGLRGCLSGGGAGGGSCALRVLQLGFNAIGPSGVRALVEVLTAGGLDGLEHLDLACNVLGPEGVAALAPLLERRPGLDDDEGTDGEGTDGGREERRGGGLYSLDLAVNNCVLDGERSGVRALMKALESNTTLRMLNLRGNDLTSEAAGDVAEMLLENNSLKQLNVGYNKILNDGAWELAEALSENTGLTGLDLQRNEISDEGGAHVAKLLEANGRIREVDMRSNMLSPKTVEAFDRRFGERVNARWQQEPPKRDSSGAPLRKMVAEGGGNVAAKRAERAKKKAARRG